MGNRVIVDLAPLRNAQEAQGLSDEQLAERTGYSPEHIRQVLTERGKPTKRFVVVMCQALGVPVDDVVAYEREAGIIDLSPIVLKDNPQEWPELAPEIMEMLRDVRPDPYIGGYPPWVKELSDALDEDRWYLIRNVEKRPSPLTGRVEEFITRAGIPLPRRGKQGIFRFYQQQQQDRDSKLSVVHTMTRGETLGHHVPITIEEAYRYWEMQRQKLRIPEATAERYLGPRPVPHLIDGRPIAWQSENRIATSGEQRDTSRTQTASRLRRVRSFS